MGKRPSIAGFTMLCLALFLPPSPVIADDVEDWQKTDPMSISALKAFVAQHPNAGLNRTAELYLSLHQKILAYRNKTAKPTVVIPFQELGLRWKSWQKLKRTGMLGYYARREGGGIEVGILPMDSDRIEEEDSVSWQVWLFNFQERDITDASVREGTRMYNNLALGRASPTSELVPPIQARAPTGEGSVIAFRTDGLTLVWLRGMKFVSNPGDTLYFGVVGGYGGLVYLQGNGKYVSPEEREVFLGVRK